MNTLDLQADVGVNATDDEVRQQLGVRQPAYFHDGNFVLQVRSLSNGKYATGIQRSTWQESRWTIFYSIDNAMLRFNSLMLEHIGPQLQIPTHEKIAVWLTPTQIGHTAGALSVDLANRLNNRENSSFPKEEQDKMNELSKQVHDILIDVLRTKESK